MALAPSNRSMNTWREHTAFSLRQRLASTSQAPIDSVLTEIIGQAD